MHQRLDTIPRRPSVPVGMATVEVTVAATSMTSRVMRKSQERRLSIFTARLNTEWRALGSFPVFRF